MFALLTPTPAADNEKNGSWAQHCHSLLLPLGCRWLPFNRQSLAPEAQCTTPAPRLWSHSFLSINVIHGYFSLPSIQQSSQSKSSPLPSTTLFSYSVPTTKCSKCLSFGPSTSTKLSSVLGPMRRPRVVVMATEGGQRWPHCPMGLHPPPPRHPHLHPHLSPLSHSALTRISTTAPLSVAK